MRVLIVDDSATSRAALVRIVAGSGQAQVVGEAVNGEDALREAERLRPDVVILDLEMPRMDGFTFLRLQMSRRPVPVIVVSANSQRTDVFKALELGALDFVAKPERGGLEQMSIELLEKCQLVRSLRIENIRVLEREPAVEASLEAARVVTIVASTGGPQAIHRLLELLPGDLPVGMLIAQHMPERFTRAFAERIGRTSRFAAREAEGGEVIAAGRVIVAPGGHSLEVARDSAGVLRAVVTDAAPVSAGEPRYTPSGDVLLASAARALGARACGVILTGMGRDGREGARALREAGGLVLAESAESAVVFGMPEAAINAGAVHEVLPLEGIARRITRFGRGEGSR